MNVGENIAKGAISPDMVMDGWMRSDGHPCQHFKC